jgi:hypothetical protein
MPVYKNGLDESGEISLCESGVIVKAEGSTLKVPFSYVRTLERISEMPLGKIGVEMQVFDQMGYEHNFTFGISESHFRSLKAALGK